MEPDYALYDGKFVRTLSLPPDHDYTSEEIARAISDYVQLFDRLMKAYLAGKYTPPEIEALYCAEQQRAAILILIPQPSRKGGTACRSTQQPDYER